MSFEPPSMLTGLFVLLVFAVVVADVALVRRVAPLDQRDRWTRIAAAVALGWLVVHAGIAASGWLEGDQIPPPVLFYSVPTMLLGIGLAFSPLGTRLATLPLGALVGLQAFRLPLEWLLHELYRSGNLPVQMTWSGLNFDVLTGVTGLGLGLVAWWRPLPRGLVAAWNVMGFGLLLIVVSIAIMSAPTALRRFAEGPALWLPFRVPFNWIVSVHVWTALVTHLVIFRALLKRSDA